MKRLILLISLIISGFLVSSSLSQQNGTLEQVKTTPLSFNLIAGLDISPDGSTVVFSVTDGTLPNGGGLMLYDRTTGETETIMDNGYQSWARTTGRYVYYTNETYGSDWDARLYDRVTQTTVTIGPEDGQRVWSEGITPEGRYLIYNIMWATCADNTTCSQIYLLDRENPTTPELVSVNSNEVPANGTGGYTEMSDDARYIFFISDGTNLVSPPPPCEDPDYCYHLYVRDRIAGTTVQVNFDDQGGIVHSAAGGVTLAGMDISGNGRFVVFPANLATEGVDAVVYVRDLQTNTTEIASVDSNEVRIPNAVPLGRNSISYDGRFVLFADYDNSRLLYLRDRTTGTTRIVSQDADGITAALSPNPLGHNMLSYASISNDGSVIVFQSRSDTLADAVPGDTGDKIFMDLRTETDPTRTPEVTPEPTQEVTPEPTPEVTPDPTQEVTPEITPEVTPEPTQEITPETTPEITSEVTPEPTQEVTPEVTPEPTPEVTPDPTQEVTPEITPEPTQEITPEVTPEPTQEVTPEITPEPTQEITPEPTQEITPEPTQEVTPEVTPEPTSVQLLRNGGFETKGTTPKLAANWKPFRLTDDQRVCDTTTVDVSYQKRCAFRFTAGGTSQISQRVVGSPFVALIGDNITLNAWVRARNLKGAQVWAVLTYDDSSKETIKLTGLNAGSYRYKLFSSSIIALMNVKSVNVIVRMRNGTGKMWIDQVELTVTPPLPLP